jgi:hypothetical protein
MNRYILHSSKYDVLAVLDLAEEPGNHFKHAAVVTDTNSARSDVDSLEGNEPLDCG